MFQGYNFSGVNEANGARTSEGYKFNGVSEANRALPSISRIQDSVPSLAE